MHLDFTYQERKAIRRMARGKSIPRSQENNPKLWPFMSKDHYPVLPKDANVLEWCDWEARMSRSHPMLNDLGMQVYELLAKEARGDTCTAHTYTADSQFYCVYCGFYYYTPYSGDTE